MERALRALDYVLEIVIWAGGIGLSITLIILPFFLIPFLHKRINLVEIQKQKEENRQVNEEAQQIVFEGKMAEKNQKILKDYNELQEKVANLQAKFEDLETEYDARTKK